MRKQVWQRNTDGDLFWDTYLHDECVSVIPGKEKDCKQDEFRAIGMIGKIKMPDSVPLTYCLSCGQSYLIWGAEPETKHDFIPISCYHKTENGTENFGMWCPFCGSQKTIGVCFNKNKKFKKYFKFPNPITVSEKNKENQG